MLSTGRVMIDIHLYCLFKYLCCSQFVHTSCSPEHTPPSPIMSKQSAVKRLFMRGSFTGRLSDGVDCVATVLFVMLQLADVEQRFTTVVQHFPLYWEMWFYFVVYMLICWGSTKSKSVISLIMYTWKYSCCFSQCFLTWNDLCHFVSFFCTDSVYI